MVKEFSILQSNELVRARNKHGKKFSSAHEAYAIIKEELDEFWDGVKKDVVSYHLLDELVQIAAMCQRAAEDLDLLKL